MENRWLRFGFASLLTGLAFAVMDGLINGNPYAMKLMEAFAPIARTKVSIPTGLTIDLFYGLIISLVFFTIGTSLPGHSPIVKGLVFGVGIWFFRVLMGVISYWIMFQIPLETLVYLAITGLVEMLILGALNGLVIYNASLLQSAQ